MSKNRGFFPSQSSPRVTGHNAKLPPFYLNTNKYLRPNFETTRWDYINSVAQEPALVDEPVQAPSREEPVFQTSEADRIFDGLMKKIKERQKQAAFYSGPFGKGPMFRNAFTSGPRPPMLYMG